LFFVRRRGVESITGPEEVSMHPTMMMALVNEIQSARKDERKRFELRSQAAASVGNGSATRRPASELARELIAAINLRTRLS
jgi:hypothetical protein